MIGRAKKTPLYLDITSKGPCGVVIERRALGQGDVVGPQFHSSPDR